MASSLRGGRPGGPGTTDRGRLPVQPRDRRGALSALALLLVVAGALGSALVVYRSGHRTDELVASRQIVAGHVLTADDFSVARVTSDAGQLIPASNESAFLGTYAAADIPAGTLLNAHMFIATGIVPADGVIVGITVPVNHRPALDLTRDDIVRVYDIPNGDASGTNTDAGAGTTAPGAVPAPAPAPATAAPTGAKVLVEAARVVEVGSTDNGTITVSLLLTSADAADVVLADASGEVAVARLPVGTAPAINFVKAATPNPTPAA